jgi:hypothetical protein
VSETSPEGLVVAHVCYSWPEAEVVTCMLKAADIPALVADRNTVGTLYYQAVALGGFRILVPGAYADDARILVDEFRATPSEHTTPESEAFRENKVESAGWVLVNLFFGWCPGWLRRRKG